MGIQASTSTVIQGNYIGTDITGTVAVANSKGIEDRGTGTMIGAPRPARAT